MKKDIVACEVRSADELILTELMFCGTLNFEVYATPDQMVALLSFCLARKASGCPKAKGGA